MSEEEEEELNVARAMLLKGTLDNVLGFALLYRNFRRSGEKELADLDAAEEELTERLRVCVRRVRGNRSKEAEIAPGDQILIFEAVLKEALAIIDEE